VVSRWFPCSADPVGLTDLPKPVQVNRQTQRSASPWDSRHSPPSSPSRCCPSEATYLNSRAEPPTDESEEQQNPTGPSTLSYRRPGRLAGLDRCVCRLSTDSRISRWVDIRSPGLRIGLIAAPRVPSPPATPPRHLANAPSSTRLGDPVRPAQGLLATRRTGIDPPAVAVRANAR
jgi:hypothetical protein